MLSTHPPGTYISQPIFQNVSVCNFTDLKGQNFNYIYFNAIHILLKPFRNHLLAPGRPRGLASKGKLAGELLCIPCQGQQFKVEHRGERC